MRITGLGHAGMFIETAGGSILCDPVIGPTFFGSWFPFPDNRGLDWAQVRQGGLPLHLAPPSRPLRPGADAPLRAQGHQDPPARLSDRRPRAGPPQARLRQLRLHPGGRSPRVRGPQAHGHAAARAERRPDRRLVAERRRRHRQHPQSERLAPARPREAAGVLEARGLLHAGLRSHLVADGLRPPAGREAELREAQARRAEQARHVLHREGGCRARLPDGRPADVPARRAVPLQRGRARERLDLHRPAPVPRAHERAAPRSEGLRVRSRAPSSRSPEESSR